MTNTPEIPVTENRIDKMTGSCANIAEYFGNGDKDEGSILLYKVALKIARERRDKPVFAEGAHHALGKIEERFRHFCNAVLNNDDAQNEKAMRLIAVLFRFLNNEHLQESCEE